MKNIFKRSFLFATVAIGTLLISGCGITDDAKEIQDQAQNIINEAQDTINKATTKEDGTYGVEETFTFDDLEITIGKDYSFVTVDNEFSDYNGKDAVKVPVTVKNLKDETHSLNMFYYDCFGSQGVEVETVGTYFDDDVDFAGDLRTGASYTKYFYIIYDGNGTYSIEFDNFTEKVTVNFEVTK